MFENRQVLSIADIRGMYIKRLVFWKLTKPLT
jgi:hypothetical protein